MSGMWKCTVGYYYLLFVKETWIYRAEAGLWTTPAVPSPKDLTIQLLSRCWKMQDRMKTDGWMILIQYLKYRTQWCRCIFRCYLKEETDYLGIVSFIHKYYKFCIIWEIIPSTQNGLKEVVKADSLKWDKGQIEWEAGTEYTERGEEPGQGWSQGKIHPKGRHKVWWKTVARIFSFLRKNRIKQEKRWSWQLCPEILQLPRDSRNSSGKDSDLVMEIAV